MLTIPQAILHSRVGYLLRLRHPYRNDPSHHESASWIECRHGVDHWIRPPRAPRRNDDVQDMGIHHHGSRYALLLHHQPSTNSRRQLSLSPPISS